MSNMSSESEMGNVKSGGQRGQNEPLSPEELRKRRQAYFDRYVRLHTHSLR